MVKGYISLHFPGEKAEAQEGRNSSWATQRGISRPEPDQAAKQGEHVQEEEAMPGCSAAAEHLPGMCETLGSIPSIAEKDRRKTKNKQTKNRYHSTHLLTGRLRQERHKFEPNLGNLAT